ncbi:phosphonate degradation HD-domain oxygenase [Hydrogenophaga sp. BPS33]|uniref:phosphonate degradation HD-domain oxygenase n=1 Tax=Hydrogenophaga sp. BPS33 TaxID=2651974 RepID=UPI00131FD5BB|nr:phosphonate degradation HD-domain oxygenase [Hydrogenophaga sp. BPS33]QHE83523.1 HD domain-containing protein [Hydrogenophaga sp. BPS33]
MALTLNDIVRLLETRGQTQYGQEAVSQLQHALQCAHLAETAGERPEVVVAALLHDLGHLLAAEQAASDEPPPDQDDLHQFMALPFLRGVFPESVLAPIRLHVDAKRYLCLMEAGYWSRLSPASKASLEQQGGIFTAEQGEAFARLPHALSAMRLRRYDDLAKVPDEPVPGLAHFRRHLEQVAL